MRAAVRLLTTGSVVIAFCGMLPAREAGAQEAPRPNVIIIMADDN